MLKLKPCPFCGGKAEIIQYGTSRCSSQIGCTDCHCELESADEGEHNGSSWNLRHEEQDPNLVYLSIKKEDLIRCVEALDTTIKLAEAIKKKREDAGKPGDIDCVVLESYEDTRNELNRILFEHVANVS